MDSGVTGRFFAQLALLLRQGIPMTEVFELMAADGPAALLRIHAKINEGEFLSKALAEMPDPFAREILPLVEQMEQEGLLVEQLEALSAWPDRGRNDPGSLLARVFAHASIFVHRGIHAGESLWLASRPEDPEALKSALKQLSKLDGIQETLSEGMKQFPSLFSPAVRRLVRQMELNGNPESTFRRLGIAFSQGWFLPGLPQA